MKPISKLIIRSIEETLINNNFNFNKQIDDMSHRFIVIWMHCVLVECQ